MATKTIKNKDHLLEFVSKRRFVRTPPDKVRVAAVLARAKKIRVALDCLKFCNLAAAKPLELTLKSALAVAKDKDIVEDNLRVLRIQVNEGPKLKRRRIVHQGRSTAILKRMSHITVVLTADGNSKYQNINSKQILNDQNPKDKK